MEGTFADTLEVIAVASAVLVAVLLVIGWLYDRGVW